MQVLPLSPETLEASETSCRQIAFPYLARLGIENTRQKMTPQDQWILQKERALAWLRLAFAVVAIIAVQLNPSRVARFPVLSAFSLGFFVLYSLAVVYLLRQKKIYSEPFGLAVTCLDLVWISLIVFSTGGSRTPFFVYYFFPVITASARWGMIGSIPVALVGIVVYGAIRFDLFWKTSDDPLGIDTYIIRSIYLAVLAYIFGFISEFEKRQNEKLLALSKTAGDVATLEERRRIMHELHDGLLQSLATLILRLEACRKQFVGTPSELEREIKSIENDTRSSMKTIRQFLAGKETQPFPPGMLIEKLQDDLKFLRDGVGLHVILDTQPEPFNPPAVVEQDLYYVLREALMNIIRHSHASRADVVLRQTEAEIQASLRDDGIGFDPNAANKDQGLGLPSMKERIKRLGGELKIESSPGKGARLSFVLPLATSSSMTSVDL
jgi:two-component system sensor histidine kinase DegS